MSLFSRYASLPYVANKPVRVLLLADALALTGAAMLVPLYALFVDRVGGDILDAGLTAAALALGSGVTCLVAGRYVDKIKRKNIPLAAGYLVIGLGFLGYAIASSVWHLALIQVAIGVAQAVQATSFDALFSLHATKKAAGQQWGAWEALAYFTQAGGALIGGFIVVHYGFESLFSIMGALTLLGGLYVLRSRHMR